MENNKTKFDKKMIGQPEKASLETFSIAVDCKYAKITISRMVLLKRFVRLDFCRTQNWSGRPMPEYVWGCDVNNSYGCI